MLDKAKNKGEPRPYLRNLNVRWFEFDLSDLLEMRFLPGEESRYTAVKGDLLICEGGYPGRAAIWDRDDPIYFQKALHRVRFHQPEHAKWLLYYLHALDSAGSLKEHFNGAGIQHFTGEALANFDVPLPPLPEQQRIVSILDEALDGIATAKAITERNLQNAFALMHSALQSVLRPNGKQWLRTTIGKQVMLQRGFDITKDEQRKGTVPVVSSGGIKSHHDTAMVKAPGVVLGRKGTLGSVYYLTEDFWPHDTTLWVKEFRGNNPRFVYHFFNNLDVAHLDSGAANPALNRNQVHPIQTDWPPLSEQIAIADKLDKLSAEVGQLQSIYQQKLAALDELKKSILHQAFTGAL